MIKVKEMKKLMERVEEFGEYEVLIKEEIFESSDYPELELRLDHHDHCVIIGIKE